jgi:2-dehydropantoate 2-reductase
MAERYAIPMPITRAIVSLARFRGEAAQQQTGQQRAQQTQQPQPAARAA